MGKQQHPAAAAAAAKQPAKHAPPATPLPTASAAAPPAHYLPSAPHAESGPLQSKLYLTRLSVAVGVALISYACNLWLSQLGGLESIAARVAVPLGAAGVPSRSATYPSNLAPDVPINMPFDNSVKVKFTLHPNGDGKGAGVPIDSSEFTHIDEVISKHCCQLANVAHTPARCAPNSGARLITDAGVRVLSFNDIDPKQRVYCVVQGLHFSWPMVKVGNVVYPKNVKSPIPGQPISLKQLSDQPRVFSVSNFVAPEEVEELLRVNQDRLTPSEVGFAGWQDDTRTSSTSWDFNSPAAVKIQERTFRVLGMDVQPHIADAMQVLRYTPDGGNKIKGQWYKPHVDWFTSEGYDGSDPVVNNGSNRMATMFLYLSDVEQGGATVFPLSTTHEGYKGGYIVHEGTVNTPGYINTQEALAACNESSEALKQYPKQGNAVLFYSQGPDGVLDPWALHGGCPPLKGTKWSANIWIWNRNRPDKSLAKDKPKAKMAADKLPNGGFNMQFRNSLDRTLEVLWDAHSLRPGIDQENAAEMVKADPKRERFKVQYDLFPHAVRSIITYDKHVFVFVDKESGAFVMRHRARPPTGTVLDSEGEVIVVG